MVFIRTASGECVIITYNNCSLICEQKDPHRIMSRVPYELKKNRDILDVQTVIPIVFKGLL